MISLSCIHNYYLKVDDWAFARIFAKYSLVSSNVHGDGIFGSAVLHTADVEVVYAEFLLIRCCYLKKKKKLVWVTMTKCNFFLLLPITDSCARCARDDVRPVVTDMLCWTVNITKGITKKLASGRSTHGARHRAARLGEYSSWNMFTTSDCLIQSPP